MNKHKGCNAERELIHLFWKTNNWTACRVAGSGSMKYPSPDILAHRDGLSLAIECKITKSDYQYLEKREIEELLSFSKISGCRPFVAVRFFRSDWRFLAPEDLKDSGSSFVITPDIAELKGLLFEDIIK